jgi:hypothetical protein
MIVVRIVIAMIVTDCRDEKEDMKARRNGKDRPRIVNDLVTVGGDGMTTLLVMTIV